MDRDGEKAVADLVADRFALAELRQVLPAIEEVARHIASPMDLRQVIARRFETYPQPERSDGAWALFWADYEEALEGVTWCAVQEGMRVWVREAAERRIPTPAELRALSLTSVNLEAQSLERGTKALAIAAAAYAEQREERTEEDKARASAAVAAFQQAQADKAERDWEARRVPVPPAPEESDVTPLTRFVIERRARIEEEYREALGDGINDHAEYTDRWGRVHHQDVSDN